MAICSNSGFPKPILWSQDSQTSVSSMGWNDTWSSVLKATTTPLRGRHFRPQRQDSQQMELSSQPTVHIKAPSTHLAAFQTAVLLSMDSSPFTIVVLNGRLLQKSGNIRSRFTSR
ncbi:hypothetical protein J3459_015887 [Metarhizium acridum]|nr:hypothetical protein J3459_015887 [Metarhizium acridum]